jgi:hypothetical protein
MVAEDRSHGQENQHGWVGRQCDPVGESLHVQIDGGQRYPHCAQQAERRYLRGPGEAPGKSADRSRACELQEGERPETGVAARTPDSNKTR